MTYPDGRYLPNTAWVLRGAGTRQVLGLTGQGARKSFFACLISFPLYSVVM